METTATLTLTAKDFASNQEIKWCPGCGDYSILKQVQSVLPVYVKEKENIVFVSGIGCSSRFPYYMDTYGVHSIHGRATAIATGIKAANPSLDVWVIGGDGDFMSIGGNHLIHLLRRNPNLKLIMFNNEIYGLTKGQYSPTSEKGKITKSTPYGSVDEPFNPAELALGAKTSFFARTIDHNAKHMQYTFHRAAQHHGTAFVEVYQNCPVFNDGAFDVFTARETKATSALYLEHGQPLLFGADNNMGIVLDGFTPRIVNVDDSNRNLLWIHDETDKTKAFILARFADMAELNLPRPFGVFYREERSCFDEEMQQQLQQVEKKKGRLSLQQIISGNKTWQVL